VLAQWIEKSHHFGDLSVQIHYGVDDEQKLKSGQAWHTDPENSLLHSRRIQKNDSKNLRLATKLPKVLDRQTPGSVSLSSSTLMQLAPQFFDTDYSS
jgi:hypothetical protein